MTAPFLISDVQREVADLYGLPIAVLCQPDGMNGIRERQFARPRQIAMYMSRQVCGEGRQRARASLTAIGRRFGGRDHTTVIHACRQVRRLIASDAETRHAVGEVGLRLIERSA